ncbi:MAG TPA: hypothetical protein VG148_06270 [Pyrinomonadaceae bacterium]|nr:hypothetical protein [Pyrinomonadaceae bacterium]
MMRGRLSKVFAWALVGWALCCPVAAQDPAARQQAESPRQSPREESRGAAAEAENVDLSITARVTARELLFRKVPNPRVEFTGRPRRETVWEADRENLPAEVRPGVTYRDIGITLRITSVFADIDRIVAEALGEIPTSDDAPPQNEPPRQDAPPEPQSAPPAAAESPGGQSAVPRTGSPAGPSARRQRPPRRRRK